MNLVVTQIITINQKIIKNLLLVPEDFIVDKELFNKHMSLLINTPMK
jgi:hypothetical protein